MIPSDPYSRAPSPAISYGGTVGLDKMLAAFDDDARTALEIGLGESLRIGQSWLGVEFMLMGLSKHPRDLLPKFLSAIGEDPGMVRGAWRGLVPVLDQDWRRHQDVRARGAQALRELRDFPVESFRDRWVRGDLPKAVITPRLVGVFRSAVELARGGEIGPDHLLLAALSHHRSRAVGFLLGVIELDAGREPQELVEWIHEWQRMRRGSASGRISLPSVFANEKTHDIDGPETAPEYEEENRDSLVRITDPELQTGGARSYWGRNLSATAHLGQLSPTVGTTAEQILQQIGAILLRPTLTSPILIGDSGVGKTAIVESLAWRLAVGTERGHLVAPHLACRRILELQPSKLTAKVGSERELARLMEHLLSEITSARGQEILFVDDFHLLFDSSLNGAATIRRMLRTALAQGQLPCIFTTSVAGYREHIEADQVIAASLSPVWATEPSPEETSEIAKNVAAQRLSPHYQLQFPPAVAHEAVRLAIRYVHDRFLPGKAIELLESAGSNVVMGNISPRSGSTGAFVVTPETLRSTLSAMTGIPENRVEGDDGQRLMRLVGALGNRVKGQDDALQLVVRTLRRSYMNLSSLQHPLSVFLLTGAIDAGGSELTLALAESLFDTETALLRLHMSEYQQATGIARLVGTPPGTLGYQEEGTLTGWLRRHPYCVVVLEDIERAHSEVQRLFTWLFRTGRLIDSRGNVASGRNAIFVMSTVKQTGANAGISLNTSSGTPGILARELLESVDAVVELRQLSADHLVELFDVYLAEIADNIATVHGFRLSATDEFKQELCLDHARKGLGTTALRRAIEDAIEDRVGERLLTRAIQLGEEVVLGATEMSQETVPGFSVPSATPQLIPPPPAIVSVPSDDLPDLAAFSSQEPTVVNKLAPEFESPRTRIELPGIEPPQAVAQPPVEQIRVELPRVEPPRAVAQPPVKQIRVELPRIEQPSAVVQPPVERIRVELPRIEQPSAVVQPPVDRIRVELPSAVKQPPVAYPETAEGRNQAILAPLVNELDEELNRKGLKVIMTEAVEERLCSQRWWAQYRQGLSTADAFDRLVKEPLIKRVQGNEFLPGDSIEICANDGYDPDEPAIEFRQKK